MIDIFEEFTNSGTYIVLKNGSRIGEVIANDGRFELFITDERFKRRDWCDSLHEAQRLAEEVMR